MVQSGSDSCTSLRIRLLYRHVHVQWLNTKFIYAVTYLVIRTVENPGYGVRERKSETRTERDGSQLLLAPFLLWSPVMILLLGSKKCWSMVGLNWARLFHLLKFAQLTHENVDTSLASTIFFEHQVSLPLIHHCCLLEIQRTRETLTGPRRDLQFHKDEIGVSTGERYIFHNNEFRCNEYWTI